MRTKVFISLIACILLTGNLLAQEPPGWVNLGDLPEAWQIRDILEIPGINVLIACGYGSYHDSQIWRSTNGGQSWTKAVDTDSYTFRQLKRDSMSGNLWAVRDMSGSNTLYYSTDNGEIWTGVSSPFSNPQVSGNTIEIIDNFVYYGGTIADPYNIALYRLNQSSLEWELVRAYPECNAITQLKLHDGNLIVFARDKDESLIRVFSHTPAELGKRVINLGKAKISTASTEE